MSHKIFNITYLNHNVISIDIIKTLYLDILYIILSFFTFIKPTKTFHFSGNKNYDHLPSYKIRPILFSIFLTQFIKFWLVFTHISSSYVKLIITFLICKMALKTLFATNLQIKFVTKDTNYYLTFVPHNFTNAFRSLDHACSFAIMKSFGCTIDSTLFIMDKYWHFATSLSSSHIGTIDPIPIHHNMMITF